ncbi:SPFH domain-containing protein [Sebaldella sp. S0638]|uniref:SPFH domain-containing protein n=1 Tax=Sebaldella sp. S0638 TaxID=2957809 RepID=UPI0020A03124|nr:SPFH domain-containing protein [Sebaldella sp. S0638]MCP1224872.1 SPFH domain-containing protein [Sebaldella sp. S0638]
MKYIIGEGERVLVFKNEKLIEYLKSGTYKISRLSNKKHEKYICEGLFETERNLDFLLLQNERLAEELQVLEVHEDEILIYYRDGIFQGGFYEGKYAFWNVVGRNSYAKLDLKTAFEMDEKIKNVFAKTKLGEMFDIIEIEDYHIALYFKSGVYEKILKSGTYAASKKYFKNTFQKIDLREVMIYDETMEKIFDTEPELIHDFDIKKVREKELLLWYQDDLFKGKCLAGSYLFWNKLKDNYFEIIDLNNGIEIDEKYLDILDKLEGVYTKYEVKDYEAGLLIIDNQYRKTLKSGVYCFWNGHQKIEVYPIDLRIKQLDMQGEEILTKDRVMLKFNFIAQYRVVDPITNYKEINNIENQIYILIQMILREYVGVNYLEDLLEHRVEIGKYVLEKVKKEERKYGIELLDAGIKDIKLAEMNGVGSVVYKEPEPLKKEKEPDFFVKEEIKEEKEEIVEEVKEEARVDIEDIIKKESEYIEEPLEAEKAEVADDEAITDEAVAEEDEKTEEEPELEQKAAAEEVVQEEETEKFSEESASAILEELSRILAKNSKK